MPPFKALEYGRDFLDFLGHRKSVTHEEELKRIYDLEFMSRRGNEGPQFSTVISALVKAKKAFKKEGRIYFNDIKVQVNHDQWRRRPRTSQSPSSGSGTQSTAMMSAASSNSPTITAPALTSEKQLAAEVLRKLKTEKKTMKANKGGIEITSDPEETFGRVRLCVDGLGEHVIKFLIVNKGADSVHFTRYTVLHQLRCFTLKGESVTRAPPLLLRSGESYKVEVWCTLEDYGYFPTTIYFEFRPSVAQSVHFSIVREMAVCARTSLAKELGPGAPYRPHEGIKPKPARTLIEEGVPPEYSGVYCSMEVKLGTYKCPHYLKELAKRRLEDSEYLSPTAKKNLEPVRSLLQSSLGMQNYSQRFHRLLHLEELQLQVDNRKYDLHDQTMILDPRNRDLVILNVPGVAEKQPSVFRGCCVKVSKSEATEPPVAYTGYVHKVDLGSLKLGFSKKFLRIFREDIKFDVEFVLNRLTLKLQHRAVDLAKKHGLGEVLFPSGSGVTSLTLPKLSLFNSQLENNPEQCAAIQHIVAGSSKPAPHLVFGPPGTGKTMTLVEAIYQVSKADSSVHILACAPQNTACDVLWERLIPPMGSRNVYRLCAINRDPSSVPKHLRTYCNWDQSEDSFVFPKKEVLMKYKVIVTTMLTAGRLVTGGIPVGHFTHVFVDEGGQAVEPECVVAVAGLLDPAKGQLVLAGDHKQLGPIVRSPLALNNGLGLSLLERLMKTNTLYEKSQHSGHFDSRFVTKLLRNYRSHGAFLKIPNELFYDNELQEFAGLEERQAYCKWRHLPQEGFPLIFHGVMGKDEREFRSPSWFNVTEIDVVVEYLVKLKQTDGDEGLPELHAEDIGIIAPFRKQIEKIKRALQSAPTLRHWTDVKKIKVGCVEEFQGQERKIIIISTVRSSDNYVRMDKDFSIGFLSNEKRFNVAVTRARSLLIVVGNPVILSKNPTWKTFISYCVRENGYRGIEFHDKGEDAILCLLMALKISVDNNPGADENSVQQE